MAEQEKKKSILSKEISFGGSKKTSIPTKTGINFIHDTEHKANVHAVIFFVIFLAALGLFTYFGVIRLLARANEAEARYSSMQAQIQSISNSMQDYDEVEAEYNDKIGSFMNTDEAASTNRMEILNMIDQDIATSIPVMSIQIQGSNISVQTAETNLSTVSLVISRLQSDPRNSYATVTTTAAQNSSSNDEVTADFEITYASASSDEGTALSDTEELTIANAPFIADKATRKFHKRDCTELNDTDDFNKVPFRTAKDALAEGYVACDVCNPS